MYNGKEPVLFTSCSIKHREAVTLTSHMW